MYGDVNLTALVDNVACVLKSFYSIAYQFVLSVNRKKLTKHSD